MLDVGVRSSRQPVLNIPCDSGNDLGVVCLLKCAIEGILPSLTYGKGNTFCRKRNDVLLTLPDDPFSACAGAQTSMEERPENLAAPDETLLYGRVSSEQDFQTR